MRTSTMTAQSIRSGITVVLAFFMLLTPFSALAEDATPPTTGDVAVPAAPAPGSLQITLTDTTGVALSGSFAVVDANGAYQDVWVTEGFGQANGLTAGTATVTQLTGTTDYAVDATPRYIEVPEGGIGYATITNAFLDADGDGVGDSVDACPAGNDAVDSDADGTADACDLTPNGDPTPTPTTEPTATATVEPAASPTATTTSTMTPVSTPVAGKMSQSSASMAQPAATYSTSASISPSSVLVRVNTTFTIRIKNEGSGRLGSATITFPGQVLQAPWAISVTGSGFVGANNGWNVTSGQGGDGLTIKVDARNENGELTPGGYVDVTFTSYVFDQAGNHQFTIKTWSDRNRKFNESTALINITTAHTPVATCDLVGSSTAPVGSYVMFRCSTNAPDVMVKLWWLTENWLLSYQYADTPNLEPPAYHSLTWSDQRSGNIDDPNSQHQHLYIFASPTERVPVGQPSSIDFQAVNPNPASGEFWTSVKTNIYRGNGTPTPTPVPTSVLEVGATESSWGGTTDLSAKVSPSGVPGSVAFYVNGSTTAASGTVSYNESTGVATLAGYAHGLPASTTPYSVRAVFTPSGSTHTGSEATNESALLVSHVPLALTDVTSEMSWTRPYSHFDATDSGWIQYTVRGTAAKGWTVQVTASEFSHGGGGPSIPAANLTFSTAKTTPGAELTTPATSGSLGTGPIVLSGTSQTPPGPYTQRLNLTMTIPGGTLVGEYTSNITITAAAAP